jgi:hypothetical protein
MKILLFGASGTAGGAVLQACLTTPVVEEVRVVVLQVLRRGPFPPPVAEGSPRRAKAGGLCPQDPLGRLVEPVIPLFFTAPGHQTDMRGQIPRRLNAA